MLDQTAVDIKDVRECIIFFKNCFQGENVLPSIEEQNPTTLLRSLEEIFYRCFKTRYTTLCFYFLCIFSILPKYFSYFVFYFFIYSKQTQQMHLILIFWNILKNYNEKNSTTVRYVCVADRNGMLDVMATIGLRQK